MKAIHGQVINIKKIPSRQVIQIITEVPSDAYAKTVALLDDKNVLITLSDLKIPYGVVTGAEPVTKATEPEEERKGGELSKWAAMRCNESEFRFWLAIQLNQDCETAEKARQLILDLCGVSSRRDIDHDEKAKGIFKDLILTPWKRFKNGEYGARGNCAN